MATPPLLEETRCVTILFVDKQHSRFEVHQIKNLLDAMEHEPGSKAKFKKATRKPLREHFRRSPWNGIFDRRHHPTTLSLFYVLNRVEECKFKNNKSYVK
jgi:hypothetical protein